MERYAANIAKVLTEPGTVVYVKSGDEKYKAQIEKAFGGAVTITVDDKIKIGGLRAENAAMRLAADETLDSILASKRGWFEEKFGNGCGLSRKYPFIMEMSLMENQNVICALMDRLLP